MVSSSWRAGHLGLPQDYGIHSTNRTRDTVGNGVTNKTMPTPEPNNWDNTAREQSSVQPADCQPWLAARTPADIQMDCNNVTHLFHERFVGVEAPTDGHHLGS